MDLGAYGAVDGIECIEAGSTEMYVRGKDVRQCHRLRCRRTGAVGIEAAQIDHRMAVMLNSAVKEVALAAHVRAAARSRPLEGGAPGGDRGVHGRSDGPGPGRELRVDPVGFRQSGVAGNAL